MRIRNLFITAAIVAASIGTAWAGSRYLTTTPLNTAGVLFCTATNAGTKSASVTVSICTSDSTPTCNGTICDNLGPWGTCTKHQTSPNSRMWCRVEVRHGNKKHIRVALTIEDFSGNTLSGVEGR